MNSPHETKCNNLIKSPTSDAIEAGQYLGRRALTTASYAVLCRADSRLTLATETKLTGVRLDEGGRLCQQTTASRNQPRYFESCSGHPGLRIGWGERLGPGYSVLF